MTSQGTQEQDQSFKKTLYAQLEVQEYWLFDPKGEWIADKLEGYRLQGEEYVAIADGISQQLQLRLAVEETLISFYRLDTGEKLMIPEELATELAAERQRRTELEAELARYRDQFGDLTPE